MHGELLTIRNWWSLALRGVVTILFGLAIFIWPALSIETMVILFGLFAFIGGIFSIFAAIQTQGGWALALEGLVGLAIGVLTFLSPWNMAVALLVLIAAWAIVAGGFDIIMAFRLNEIVSSRWLLAVSGVLSVLFGLILVSKPGAGLLLAAWFIGTYAVICGMLIFGFALHLHGLQKRP